LFERDLLEQAKFDWWRHPALLFVPIREFRTEEAIIQFKEYKGKIYIYDIEELRNFCVEKPNGNTMKEVYKILKGITQINPHKQKVLK